MCVYFIFFVFLNLFISNYIFIVVTVVVILIVWYWCLLIISDYQYWTLLTWMVTIIATVYMCCLIKDSIWAKYKTIQVPSTHPLSLILSLLISICILYYLYFICESYRHYYILYSYFIICLVHSFLFVCSIN